ncbi:MAG TPA: 2,4'-dihydroxyacetophenone dioxygenase family protein [Myxococcota bacterium]|nr:2,4'-dihydroxyacetophenone dioxygenase family protein [Myxococcota bacterium]
MNVRVQPEEYVSTRSMSWAVLSPGIWMKVLRLSPESGTWTVLLRAEAGASFARHRHLAAGEYFMLSGKMEVRGGAQAGGTTAVAGDYGWEPVSVIHDHTFFPEETEFLFTNHGAVQFVDEQGNTTAVLDWEAIQSLAQIASARAA